MPDETVTDLAAEVERVIEKENEQNKDFIEDLKFKEYAGEDRVISTEDAINEIKEKGDTVFTYRCGFPKIDALMENFEEGELIVISGAQKNGKTTLAQSFTQNMCGNGNFPLWFSFEVSTHNFLKKFPKLPHFHIPRRVKNHGIDWIEERIIESQVKYGTRIVFIDHLHYLISLGQSINTSLLIGAIMRELKTIAIDRKIVIFLLAHTQKIRIENVPDLADLRDSSFIAQEADAVMMIKRHGIIAEGIVEFDNTAGIYLLANRRTGNLDHIELILENNMLREMTFNEISERKKKEEEEKQCKSKFRIVKSDYYSTH
ncbi:MAG: hypothetical protein EHM47_00350 [Ignavibacteriales bacterium]|nr:MAG: hypothetical protein EHM47_00350 [Ignavibacteriales bacterium]